MLRAEPVTVICILISVRSFLAHTNQMQITVPQNVTCKAQPDAFIYSKKWPVLIRPSLAGFDSTADKTIFRMFDLVDKTLPKYGLGVKLRAAARVAQSG